jgi:hypothetical protein
MQIWQFCEFLPFVSEFVYPGTNLRSHSITSSIITTGASHSVLVYSLLARTTHAGAGPTPGQQQREGRGVPIQEPGLKTKKDGTLLIPILLWWDSTTAVGPVRMYSYRTQAEATQTKPTQTESTEYSSSSSSQKPASSLQAAGAACGSQGQACGRLHSAPASPAQLPFYRYLPSAWRPAVEATWWPLGRVKPRGTLS